ncbi:glycosyltransferase family 4 protein [Hymenobacter negativus]|uniref:Glycosyltransferase family 4 protein n=1 Tax=Hymenobacter negativus TaxID=2795026 RepID=A0ABS3QE58_9BACT|nr:glycosyltransferase family 4 protein [Hymenobacter negativus]MBO2009529.1 glycosyltransferase family 4 protein [Hymenobacter negativus]
MITGKRLRIGFISSTDPLNRRSWSGVHYSIFKALERNIGEVVALGPVTLRVPFALGDRLNNWILKPLTGKRYHYSWSVFISRWYARIFGRKLAKQHFDLLVAPASFTEIAYLRTDVPVVYIEDSTLNQLIDFYPGLSQLLPVSKKELNYIEKRALNMASLVCYSSDWAAQSAREDYGTPVDKIVVIPFGSNYPDPPTREQAQHYTPAPDGSCRLFLLGGEWGRKGGAIAYDTMLALQKRGIPATLTVVGCRPPDPENYTNPGFRTIPFLNMGVPADRDQLHELFSTADFFLLPSRAECAAIAFCDANSFGLPVFTTDVGGIASFVQPGVNGYMLPLAATGEDFATQMQKILADPALYQHLRKQSRAQYEALLNWDHWASSLWQALEEKNLLPAKVSIK